MKDGLTLRDSVALEYALKAAQGEFRRTRRNPLKKFIWWLGFNKWSGGTYDVSSDMCIEAGYMFADKFLKHKSELDAK